MRNPYSYTLAEVLGMLPEWRDEIASIVDQISGYHEVERERLSTQEMERRDKENLEQKKRVKPEKPIPFDMGL